MNFHGANIYEYTGRIIDFSSNINPLGVPESFKKMLLNSLDEFTRYPDINYRALKEDIADYIGLKDSSHVVPGNGAVELLYKAIGKSGKKKVIGLAPTFSEYSRAASFYHMDFISAAAFDEELQQVDIDYIAGSADRDSVVVICNPNNPTGTLVTKSQMVRLAGRLQEKGSRLIIDEAFMEFTPDYPANSMISELQNYSNVLVVKAATKFFGMPGIRLGYAVCQDSIWLNDIKEGLEPWNVNTAAVIAGRSVFKDKEYIRRSQEWIEEERKYLYDSLSRIEKIKVYKSSANFHLVKLLDERTDAWKLKEKLLQHRILIRTPEGFEGLNGQYARLAVKDRESNEMLIKYL
ncbi:MAG: putative L-threonine-O-3-phosphate decarboxylase [Clostridia bacterium]|jgi:threonine-phosphate decarboxylase|nr:putative L-threonine-O-3-phosphate decarboxylase [Clostridia bacterium]